MARPAKKKGRGAWLLVNQELRGAGIGKVMRMLDAELAGERRPYILRRLVTRYVKLFGQTLIADVVAEAPRKHRALTTYALAFDVLDRSTAATRRRK